MVTAVFVDRKGGAAPGRKVRPTIGGGGHVAALEHRIGGAHLRSITKRIRRSVIAAGATVALGVGLFAGLGPTPSGASSHREAPLTSADPQIDGTDLYAFVSPDKPSTVTLISNWIPLESPTGGPNFYSFAPGVYYDINIDNNGDAKPDIIYRWVFRNNY